MIEALQCKQMLHTEYELGKIPGSDRSNICSPHDINIPVVLGVVVLILVEVVWYVQGGFLHGGDDIMNKM